MTGLPEPGSEHRPKARRGVEPTGPKAPAPDHAPSTSPASAAPPAERAGRVGVWLVGVRGSVAVTTICGALAASAGHAPPLGCVTATTPFARCALVDFRDLVFGGHDVDTIGLRARARRLVADGVLPHGLPDRVGAGLDAIDARVRPGVAAADPRPQADQIAELVRDIEEFARTQDLTQVVVVHLASTEPLPRPHPAHASATALGAALETGVDVLPPSARYAWAAALAGCAFVDFTPSAGARIPGVAELFVARGVPYAGSDGKTGETLLKSVLAPMFAQRALRVTSWSGTNLLGGGDGETLSSPERAAAKVESKDRALRSLLGRPVGGGVHIHNVPELGEWKTAWDHVSFEGFLGTRMNLQFTWTGCDSALAAPLVLDLVRLTARARAVGCAGPLRELAFYFKDPVASDEHALSAQYETLLSWARERLAAGRKATR